VRTINQQQPTFEQVMSMIYNLPKDDVKRVKYSLVTFMDQYEQQEKPLTDLQKLLLSAPTWTDEDYQEYLDRHSNFVKWKS
jgi:hypothetical protein